jgi:hypothetical protein
MMADDTGVDLARVPGDNRAQAIPGWVWRGRSRASYAGVAVGLENVIRGVELLSAAAPEVRRRCSTRG